MWDSSGRRLSSGFDLRFRPRQDICLMKEIGKVVNKGGGWPGAFKTGDAEKAGKDPIVEGRRAGEQPLDR
jgi:hypothetical protein